eukprot:1944581-Prymnesium_polylepis.1
MAADTVGTTHRGEVALKLEAHNSAVSSFLLPIYKVKRPVDFGSRLRANEDGSDKKLYGSLDQRDERS